MAALAGSLFIGGLLASCGGRLEEVLDKLLDKSRLLSVTATPNPVPAPADGSSTPFALRVDFDSNNSLDVIRVLLENPAGSGNYVLIGQPDACQGGTAEACGNGWRRNAPSCKGASGSIVPVWASSNRHGPYWKRSGKPDPNCRCW